MVKEKFKEVKYFKLDIRQISLHLFTLVDCTTYNVLNIQSINITLRLATAYLVLSAKSIIGLLLYSLLSLTARYGGRG